VSQEIELSSLEIFTVCNHLIRHYVEEAPPKISTRVFEASKDVRSVQENIFSSFFRIPQNLENPTKKRHKNLLGERFSNVHF